ncbi:1-phosphatidylinositol 4,5-bisphosphate phosphodiesterase delta-1, partial [Dipsacomyces acuminosporus]
NHCSIPQQKRMAAILRRRLGKLLLLEPLHDKSGSTLPSPEQLRGRIIIKNKVLDESSGSQPSSLASSSSSTSAAGLNQGKTVSPRTSKGQLKPKVAPELSELIVYCKAVHFEGFDDAQPEPAFDQVTSVPDTKSSQLIRECAKRYRAYNTTQMTRVYPSFSHINSTNFNPIPHWRAGCQLVAMNYQTVDRDMQLYEAMFRRTQSAGYVPKPKHLRSAARSSPV